MALFRRAAKSNNRIKTVLIVEDEPLVAFENERALARAGYRVVETVDRYSRVVDAMRIGGVDLVVTDIGLVGQESGIDVARMAGKHRVPVLFSSGSCPEEALSLGAGWLAKPYVPRDLVRAVMAIDRMLGGLPPRPLPDPLTLFPPA